MNYFTVVFYFPSLNTESSLKGVGNSFKNYQKWCTIEALGAILPIFNIYDNFEALKFFAIGYF